jgi:hypothetical protein
VFTLHSNEKKATSRDCIGSSRTALPPGRYGVQFQTGPGNFISSKISRPALGNTQALIQWVTENIFSKISTQVLGITQTLIQWVIGDIFSKISRPALDITQALIQWVTENIFSKIPDRFWGSPRLLFNG